jgi:predicted nucleic acid-binding protein
LLPVAHQRRRAKKAFNCRATFLITGDKDLLTLPAYDPVTILSLINFLARLPDLR